MVATPRAHLISESGSGFYHCRQMRLQGRSCVLLELSLILIAAWHDSRRGLRDALRTVLRRIVLNQPSTLSRHPVSQLRVSRDIAHCVPEFWNLAHSNESSVRADQIGCATRHVR